MSSKLRNRFFLLLSAKEQRENRRIPQIEVANTIGVTPQTIWRWMHNDVTRYEAEVIEKLCDYFGCEVGDLLYLEHESSM